MILEKHLNFGKECLKENKGKEPPQFMSTHPSSKNRIINLNNGLRSYC